MSFEEDHLNFWLYLRGKFETPQPTEGFGKARSSPFIQED